MKIIREGFKYEVENFENKTEHGQFISFVEKERDGDMTFLVQDGTTIEELIDVLVDRMSFLNSKHPCMENWVVIQNLKTAKFWMIERQREKNKRLKLKGIK